MAIRLDGLTEKPTMDFYLLKWLKKRNLALVFLSVDDLTYIYIDEKPDMIEVSDVKQVFYIG